MEELSLKVLQGFGIKPRSVIKRKLFYICNTDSGTKVIKKVPYDKSESKASINFQHYIKESLYEKGYKHTDRFNLSIDNEPYFIHEGTTYIATDYLPYRETNFADIDEFKAVIANVAIMHLLAKDIKAIDNASMGNTYRDVEDIYNDSIIKLKGYKKIISKCKQLSDFDVLFCKNYDYYIECLNKWHKIISDSNYDEINKKSIENGFLCHNLLKEEYILVDKNDVYITNFFECTYRPYINDLVSLIKRHFKANPDNPLKASDIIIEYNKKNNLSQQDIKIIYALLIYPDKFIKISNQFYIKKRTWIPGTFKARMELLIQTKDSYMHYINEIYDVFLKNNN